MKEMQHLQNINDYKLLNVKLRYEILVIDFK